MSARYIDERCIKMETILQYLDKLVSLIKIKSKSIINKTYAVFVLLTPTHRVTIQKIGNEYVILVKQQIPDENLSPLITNNDRLISSVEKNNDNAQSTNVLTLKCKTTYKMLKNDLDENRECMRHSD